jgi:hypothetical protein
VFIFSAIMSTHVTERYEGDKIMYSADSGEIKNLVKKGVILYCWVLLQCDPVHLAWCHDSLYCVL